MKEDLLQQIEQMMPTFSKSQKLIANYILNHYEKAAYMTALKLGNAVNVSESTVVRFAIELGYEGYPQLQRSLQSHIKNRLTSIQLHGRYKKPYRRPRPHRGSPPPRIWIRYAIPSKTLTARPSTTP